MRLAQLARKLNIKQQEIIDFLHEKNVDYKIHSNTKIADEHVALTFEHYDPDLLEELQKEAELDQKEEEKNIEASTSKAANEEAKNEKPEADIEIVSGTIEDTNPGDESSNLETSMPAALSEDAEESQKEEEEQEQKETKEATIHNLEEDTEVIRAPKMKLEGIKVVGKIDLPEPKEKEEPAAEAKEEAIEDKLLKEIEAKIGASAEKKLRTQVDLNKYKEKRGRSSFENKKKKGRRSKQELSYEEKIKKEEHKLEREKQKRLKKEKHKKKKHYELMMKERTGAPVKPKVKKNKKEAEQKVVSTAKKPVHSNLIRRFWGWLIGEYDD